MGGGGGIGWTRRDRLGRGCGGTTNLMHSSFDVLDERRIGAKLGRRALGEIQNALAVGRFGPQGFRISLEEKLQFFLGNVVFTGQVNGKKALLVPHKTGLGALSNQSLREFGRTISCVQK